MNLHVSSDHVFPASINTWVFNNKSEINTLINSINVKLGKNNNVVGMASTICDPVFLCQGIWSIDDEFLCFLVIGGCCFHLHCIVTIAKFSQTKATHILKCVHTLKIEKRGLITM